MKNKFLIAIAASVVLAMFFACGQKNDPNKEAEKSNAELTAAIEHLKQEQSKMSENDLSQKNKTELKEGESLYKGKANFEQIQNFEVSFILSADKSEIHDLKIAMNGLNITARYENMKIQETVGNSTTNYMRTFPVQNNKADISFGKDVKLLLVFNNAGATGTIAYTYIVRSTTGQNGHPDIPVDFGKSAIQFQKQ